MDISEKPTKPGGDAMQAPDILSHDEMFAEANGVMWKKCVRNDGNEVVLMMEAKDVESGDADKFELIAGQVKVIAIYDMWGYKTSFKHANSPLRPEFVYEVGKTLDGPIWGFPTFEMAQRKWVGQYGASKDIRYVNLATSGWRELLK